MCSLSAYIKAKEIQVCYIHGWCRINRLPSFFRVQPSLFAEGPVQGPLGLDKLLAVDGELHIGLARGLGHRQDVDIVSGQRLGCLCQDTGLADVGADGADDGHRGGDQFESFVELAQQLRRCSPGRR